MNAEIGLQLLVAGYRVKEVPVSWIGRGVSMGTSSFHLSKAGGGYWRVLRRSLAETFLRNRSVSNAKAQDPRSPEINLAFRLGLCAGLVQLAEISPRL